VTASARPPFRVLLGCAALGLVFSACSSEPTGASHQGGGGGGTSGSEAAGASSVSAAGSGDLPSSTVAGSGGGGGGGTSGGAAVMPAVGPGGAGGGQPQSGSAGPGNGGASASGAAGTAGGSASGTSGGSGTAGAGGSAGDFLVCGATATSKPKAVKIYFIGDSTASVYASDLYPRMGWGQPLGELFASACATVVDKALSGRSSKSFYDEGDWTPVQSALKSGDYVLIEFGHNDEKSDDPVRYTDPETTYKQYLTKYVQDSRAKQAVPILITSINRNDWSGTSLSDTHGQYPPAVRELAQSLRVPLIDMTALTKTYFERLGQAETTKLFMDLAPGQFPNYPTGNTDDTHLQEIGAHRIGQLAMSDAYQRKLALASLLKAAPTPP
jgi:lysophospholipase L1-like esterase